MRILALLLLLTGCMVEPSKDEPYPPPEVYRVWWAEVEDCSGQAGDFDRLRFFELEPDSRYAGRRFGNDIFIRDPYRMSRLVVEHEMLHVLGGDSGHHDRVWTTCGLYPLTVGQALEGT